MRNFLYFFLLFCGVFLIFFACRKIETTTDNVAPSKLVDRFFSVPATAPAQVKALAEAVKKQDQKYRFVPDVIVRLGYPAWDKARIVSRNGGAAGRSRSADTSGSGDIVYVPFVRDSQNAVASVLAVKMNASDTSFSMMYANRYRLLGYDTTNISKWNARSAFKIFTDFDHAIFGHTKFLIKDDSLFRTPSHAIATLLEQNGQTVAGRTTYYQTECNVYRFCEYQLLARTTGVWACLQFLVCLDLWYDDGNLLVGAYGTGEANGWWQPAADPCGSHRMALEDPDDGGGGGDNNCGPGWVPYIEGDPILEGTQAFDNWPLSTDDQMKMEYWRDHNIDTTGLDSCRKLLLKKLVTALNSTPLGRILAKMDRANNEPTNIEKFKIKYQIKPIRSAGSTDSVSYDSGTGIFSVLITLDSSDVSTGTDLYIAGTIVHETIHAYMKSLLYRTANGITITQLQAMGYDSVFNQYINLLVASNQTQLNAINTDSKFQHNYMANKLVNIIAEALKLFDGDRINDDRYYWFIAWKGLFGSDAWKEHWPNYPYSPIQNAPFTTDDSTRGLKYALTPARLDSVTDAIRAEEFHYQDAKGRPPVLGGCY